MKRHGLAVAHSRPLIGYGKDADGVWVPGAFDSRTSPERAWRYWPELEWAQDAVRVGAIVLDVDDMDAFLASRLRFDADGVGAPPPSLMVVRRANSHAHVAYILRDPVFVGPGAKGHQIRWLKRLEAWLVETTGADPAYPAILVHNPMRTRHATRKDWQTVWGRRKAYTLGELAKCVRQGFRMPTAPQGGVNRLCAFLQALGRWYGQPAHWWAELPELLEQAVQIDAELGRSTGYVVGAEGITPSVRAIFDNQRARLAKGEQQAAFSAIQSRRGRKSSRAIEADQESLLRQARSNGATLAEAAAVAGVSVRTAKAKVGRTRAFGERRATERRKRVAGLLEGGMGVRAIGRHLGCHHRTVQRDVDAIEARRTKATARNAAFLARFLATPKVAHKCK